MARQDSSAGWPNFNYTQTVAVTSETALLAPSASGVSPYFPSPDFPLSTTTYPTGVYVGIPADITGSVYDGHPFEVSFSAVLSSTATTNMLVNLYQAKASTFAGGPAATGYTLATLGTGCTKVVTGTATAGLTSTVSQNFWMKVSFVWDSTTGKLGYCIATQYQSGAAPAIASSASVTGPLAIADLNFIPSFTFASAATTTVTVKEFVINRL
jgi:hypothetical protein